MLSLCVSCSKDEQPAIKLGYKKYYGNLVGNHVSPYFPIRGNHEMDSTTAKTLPHYIFIYDANDRLTSIINNHPRVNNEHPLIHLSRIDSVAFSYSLNTETRIFYNKKGDRVRNLKQVYKEIYTYENNKLKQLEFKDVEDNAMQSNWNIAKYVWFKKDSLTIEKRYNLKNDLVSLSPYFNFGITGITCNEKGLPKAHYNLDTNYIISNSSFGVASYKDTYDSQDHHIKYAYYNNLDKPVNNPWGYSIGILNYDSNGEVISLDAYDYNNNFIFHEVF